jgi:hypothetical protein
MEWPSSYRERTPTAGQAPVAFASGRPAHDPVSGTGLGRVETLGRERYRRHERGGRPCLVSLPSCGGFSARKCSWCGLPPVLGGSATGYVADIGDDYGLIAATSGAMPKMFMTRVRL